LNVTEALHARRATKHFDPAVALPDAELEDLLRAASLAPSSYNLQHWHLVAVRDPERRAAMAAAAHGQQSVADASCVVVLAADPRAWQQAAERWQHLAPDKRAKLAGNVAEFYTDDEQLCRDEAVRSVSLYAMALMLVAAERGWASCPYIGFDPDAVREVARMPDELLVVLLIALGKPSRAPSPRPPRRELAAVLHREVWDPTLA
jgi:nitroreductase